MLTAATQKLGLLFRYFTCSLIAAGSLLLLSTSTVRADDVNGACPFTQTRSLCNSSGQGSINCPALTAGFPGEGANNDANDNFDLTAVQAGSVVTVTFTNLLANTATVTLQNNGGDTAPAPT